MIERIMSIADREANKAEKAKAWIILVFLFIPAAAGYWVVIRWINWQTTPSHEGYFNLTESGLHLATTISIGFLIMAILLAVSALYARREYRESTYLHELQKGYHEPIMSHNEPINTDIVNEEVRDVRVRMEINGQTDFPELPMTSTGAIRYFERLVLNANEIRQLIEEHKGWKPVVEYLENRKIRANVESFYALPGNIKTGQEVSFPV